MTGPAVLEEGFRTPACISCSFLGDCCQLQGMLGKHGSGAQPVSAIAHHLQQHKTYVRQATAATVTLCTG